MFGAGSTWGLSLFKGLVNELESLFQGLVSVEGWIDSAKTAMTRYNLLWEFCMRS